MDAKMFKSAIMILRSHGAAWGESYDDGLAPKNLAVFPGLLSGMPSIASIPNFDQ